MAVFGIKNIELIFIGGYLFYSSYKAFRFAYDANRQPRIVFINKMRLPSSGIEFPEIEVLCCREDRVKALGSKIIEQENSQKLRDFRSLVTSKMIRPWSDTKDIKIAVMETMHEFSLRYDLIGWVPGSEAIDGGILAEEMARLTKENERLSLIANSDTKTTYSGLTFDEMLNLLQQEDARIPPDYEAVDIFYIILEAITQRLPSNLENGKPNMLQVFIVFVHTMDISNNSITFAEAGKLSLAKELVKFGLINVTENNHWETEDDHLAHYRLTEDGFNFSLKLKAKGLW